jgi:RNA polymerase sigma factor (sigma-70 family)
VRVTDSFDEFYVATAQKTFATALLAASGDPEVAREATDEAYAVMAKRWSERCHRTLSDNQSYVIGIALNKVADWFRRNERFVPLPDDDDLPAVVDVVDELTLYKEVRRILEDCSPVARSVGILYFLEEFQPVEIAEALDMDPSTVRTHLQRLRERLRPLIERWLDEGRDGDD